MENNDPVFVNIYERFFKRLDDLIGQVVERIDDGTSLILLSDHGFTTLKQEVYLNRWLWENDYLVYKSNSANVTRYSFAIKGLCTLPGQNFYKFKR